MKTMSDKLALMISAWVVLSGGYVCYVNTERQWQSVLGIALLSAAWLIRHLFHGSSEARLEARHKITQSIAYAGLLLSVGLFEALGWATVSGEFRVRASQFLAGAFVMVIGNAIPKRAISSQRRAALLRANGKAFVLGGLGYVLAWLVLPLAYANEVAMATMLLSLAYVCARIASCFIHSNRPVPPA